ATATGRALPDLTRGTGSAKGRAHPACGAARPATATARGTAAAIANLAGDATTRHRVPGGTPGGARAGTRPAGASDARSRGAVATRAPSATAAIARAPRQVARRGAARGVVRNENARGTEYRGRFCFQLRDSRLLLAERTALAQGLLRLLR